MDNLYGFMMGQSIAGTSPEPPLGVLVRAERMEWHEIIFHMHTSMKASEALIHPLADGLLWIREVMW